MQSQDILTFAQRSRPRVVLDTNVVLALYWFKDPLLVGLSSAIAQGRLDWITTTAMREELCHVLEMASPADGAAPAKALKARTGSTAVAVMHAFDQRSTQVQSAPPGSGPRCSDPDDQKFVDLARDNSAAWLLSRDRAILKLRRSLIAAGCRVARPEDWPVPPGQPC